jgi:hypothetical protein
MVYRPISSTDYNYMFIIIIIIITATTTTTKCVTGRERKKN